MSSRDFDAVVDKVALAQSVAKLSPYFQLSTARDLAETLALQAIQGFTSTIPNEQLRPPREITNLIKLVVDTSDGALTTARLIEKLGQSLQGSPDNTTLAPMETRDNTTSRGASTRTVVGNRLASIIKIFYANIQGGTPYPFYDPSMSLVLSQPEGQGTIINGTPSNPDKEHPGLSVIQITNCQVMPAGKNINAITLFLNGLPSLELSRAIPFVNVQFFFGRDATDFAGRLQSMSLVKFLEGGISVGANGVTRLLVDANVVSGSIEGQRDVGVLSTAGMELFCSPQTLVNANESYNRENRTVPVLDPFRPFMTFKRLNIDIAPAAGLMSYKTAKLEFVLHDRSRLHEIADFIKPDLYGTTELLLEYGWNHPDGSSSDNPYGVLINGMRSREKYGIRNMSLSMDDAGQVNVTLDLFMKGSNEFETETIASEERGTGDILRDIERLARTVSAYERRVFPGGTNAQPQEGSSHHTREIRGTQILATAADYRGQLRLSPEILTNLQNLQTDLTRGSGNNNRNVQTLVGALRQLYNTRNSTRGGGDESALTRLSYTTQRSIEERLRRAVTGGIRSDGFLPHSLPTNSVNNRIDRNLRNHNANTPASRGGTLPPSVTPRPVDAALLALAPVISLGKLLTVFVGQPLALTKKYDDVQLVFYPFNKYAGAANTYNISQFVVDTNYFVRQYTRFRTENASRAANMTLKDFLGFLASTILDDPAATMYGISSAYEFVNNRTTGEQEVTGRGNQVEFQTTMENLLRRLTPDATFKMPQVDFYIECVPGKTVKEGETTSSLVNQSILRIHIYDKQSTQYDTQANLLASSRDDVLQSIGTLPLEVQEGNEGIISSYRATASAIISLAESENLIEKVHGPGTNRAYRIRQGPERIKDFIKRTMPYILYGVQGTAIKGAATLSTQQDAALSTVNMLRSFRAGPLEPNGEQPGGLPLSMIPCELTLTTWGCPLIDFAQQFFCDFNTGTTADNIYGVINLSHRFEAGDFVSELKLAPLDAYGKYNSMMEQVNHAANRLAPRT